MRNSIMLSFVKCRLLKLYCAVICTFTVLLSKGVVRALKYSVNLTN